MSRRPVVLCAAACFSLAACGSGSKSPTAAHIVGNTTTTVATTISTGTPSTTAPVLKLTSAQKAQVQQTLFTSLSHYVDTWHQGRAVLDHTQYPDSFAGLDAMNDPSSAAAKFSAWRTSTKIEQDLGYLDAFKTADDNYTAANEPPAIGTWRDDMGQLQGDIAVWVTDAVGWQIRDTTDAKLQSDTDGINADISKAQADAASVIGGS